VTEDRATERPWRTLPVPLQPADIALIVETVNGDDRLRGWVRSRAATEWSPGFSGDFQRGYDAAVAEVASLLGENVEP
jgi:hypothetical protein